MIEGLKIEMSTDQLSARLAERILWHQQTVDAYEEELSRSRGGSRDGRRNVLEQEMREHQEQVVVLSLLRDHLIPNEVYRLMENDLRFADLAPDPYLGGFIRPRFAEESAEVSGEPA